MAIINNQPAKNYEDLSDEELMADIDDYLDKSGADAVVTGIIKRRVKQYSKSNKRGKYVKGKKS